LKICKASKFWNSAPAPGYWPFFVTAAAIVTATDVSKIAIQNLHENAKLNNAYLQIIESDLFDSLNLIILI